MDIWKMIYWCLWLHIWFSAIYSIDLLRRIFWTETPESSPRKQELNKSVIEAFNMLKEIIGEIASYICLFIGVMLSTLITFAYIRKLFRRKKQADS